MLSKIRRSFSNANIKVKRNQLLING